MDDPEEIALFYEKVGRYLRHMKNSKQFDCLTYIGDPNKHASAVAKQAEEALMAELHMVNLIGDMPTRIEGETETQPDSCYSWFDPSVVTVSAAVEGKVHQKMDHRLIRLRYLISGVKPEKRSFFTFKRRVRDKSLDDGQVGGFLNCLLQDWMKSFAPFIRGSMQVDYDGDIVDCAVDELYAICRQVQEFMTKEVVTKLPTAVSTKDNPDRVRIGQLSALLAEFSYKIMKSPENIRYREAFIRIEKEKTLLMNSHTQKLLESQMKHMSEKLKPGTKKFYDITGKLLAKDKFSEKSTDMFSPEERQEKLEKNDATFFNDAPGFGSDIDEYKNITPEFEFELDPWDPLKNDKLSKIFKTIKMDKKDYFFKVHRASFVAPIFVILKMIKHTGHFPKSMRKSKLTFLPNRSIFSLDPLTKIVESVLAKYFN